MLTYSALGRAWTARCEGCSLTAYEDPKGSGTYSVGYGHHGVPAGTTWTQKQAEDALDGDLYGAWYALTLHVKEVELTQGQVDALVDFIFNEGSGKFAGSTLLSLLKIGEFAGACRELYRRDDDGTEHGWIYVDGKISQALIARRKGEQVLWNGGSPLETVHG